MFPDKYSNPDVYPWADHFVLFLLLSVTAILIGSFIAGFTAKRKGRILGAILTIPIFIPYFFFWIFNGAPKISPYGQVFFPLSFWGWWIWDIPLWLYGLVMLILFFAAGIIGGHRGQLFAEEDKQFDTEPKRKSLFNIWWVHWLWLWIPIQYLALDIFRFGYTIWLDFALGWHFAFHPSLWFQWQWWLYGLFGIGISWMPIGILLLGYFKAFEVLAEGWRRGLGKLQVVWRFLVFWLLVPVGANIINVFVLWIFSNLPIILPQSGRPWWIIF